MQHARASFGTLALLVALSGQCVAEVGGTWGLGIAANYELPVSKLNQWFPSGGPQFGGTLVHVINDSWTAEVEAHWAKYSGGDLEDRAFLWSVDGQKYKSPQASSSMSWATGVINWVRHFDQGGKKLQNGGGAPYALIGAGFFHYENDISGLVYPAQNATPLDTSKLLRPVSDVRTALGINMGLGVQYFASETMAIDIRGQYNMIFGTVRPLEAWGLQEVFPFQKLNVGVRLKLYFTG